MSFDFKNRVTELLNCKYPIIAGPMFLVSNEKLVCAVSKSGAVGGIPSLNYRTKDQFEAGLVQITSQIDTPYAVNLIVNKANPRLDADLSLCKKFKVPLIITSLGNPQRVIDEMHEVGSKVFCDVTDLNYAKKVEALGADGVIAVSSGAGGHAGSMSPLVLIPHLAQHLSIPVVAAGGIATGQQMAACFLLGASAVQIGTRFIATVETEVGEGYKNAILASEPEDIFLTRKISGVPVSVIRTPYTEKMGVELSAIEKFLLKSARTKKWMKMLRSYRGMKVLSKAIGGPTWKEVWSAGQGVGFIDKILPADEVVENLMKEFLAFYPSSGATAQPKG